ncbi:MAG: DUF4271 domain-containing protein [Prolixibacteraceae bacterium]
MTSTDSILYQSIFTYLPDTTKSDTLLFYQEVKPEVILPQHNKKSFIGDWSVILILTMLIIIASIRITSEKYLIHLVQSIFNSQTATRLFRERVINILHPAFRLEILFYLSMGLFIAEIGENYLPYFHQQEWLLFLISTLVVLLYTNGKYLIYGITGFLFNVQSEVSEYIYYSRSGNRVMGLFLLPIATLFLFFNQIGHEILLIFGILTVLLFSVISLFKGIKINASKDFPISYLILYLCCLEILPLLIVWRILTRM